MIQSLYIIGLLLCFRRCFNGTRCAALCMWIVSNNIIGLLLCFRRSFNGTRCAALCMWIVSNKFGRGGRMWPWRVLEC
jgi:hypothetical protein